MAKRETDEITIPAQAMDAFNDAAQQVAPNNQVTPVQGKVFTEAEVENIRKQEKDKMYKRLEDSDLRSKAMEEQLKVLAQDRETAIKEAQGIARKEEEIRKQREFEELTSKQLLAKTEDEFNTKIKNIDAEWQLRFSAIEEERKSQQALLDKERELRELETYRQRKLHEEQENIIPELIDLVSGNTPAEVDASVDILRQRSAAILQSVQQATQPRQIKGVSVTSPSTGPMENQQEYQTLNSDDIRNMTMDQYVKMRDRLLSSRPNKGRF